MIPLVQQWLCQGHRQVSNLFTFLHIKNEIWGPLLNKQKHHSTRHAAFYFNFWMKKIIMHQFWSIISSKNPVYWHVDKNNKSTLTLCLEHCSVDVKLTMTVLCWVRQQHFCAHHKTAVKQQYVFIQLLEDNFVLYCIIMKAARVY